MIFGSDLAKLIRGGSKTQTRRPATSKPLRYKAGKHYAVQPGRCQAGTCRIEIVDVRQEAVGEITYPDARREGFKTTDDFKAYWVSLYDRKWLEGEHAMLDEAEDEDGPALNRDVWITRRSVDMFDQRHAHKPVWVISFHLHTAEVPRFLARRSDELYTNVPALSLAGEPEAVDEDTQRRITKDALTTTAQWRQVEQARRDTDRALLSREDQIVRLRRAARLRSVDASRELWALERMKATCSAQAFTTKVQNTERKVFAVQEIAA